MSARSEQLPPDFYFLPPPPVRPHFVQFQAIFGSLPLKSAIFRIFERKSNFMSGPHDNELCILLRN